MDTLAVKAREELNEEPLRLEEDLQHLKDWIAKQPHLRARTDDQWLVAFLRGCKFSLERVKQKLDLYYTVRTTAPEFFKISVKDPKFHDILDLGSYYMLPKTTGTYPTVTIISPGKFDPNTYHISEIMCVTRSLEKIMMMENDNGVVSGSHFILNLENVTLGHLVQMTPATMKKMVTIGQDATPLRIKGVHFLNTRPGFETVFNALKSLLNEKNRQRLYVHNKNYEEMYKYIPKDILPSEYGGYGGTESEITEYWKQKVKEYRTWLEEDEEFGTDETLRPVKPNPATTGTTADVNGVEGSFRKLEVD
ncbi:CRAL/TRIO domain-containing protein [Phthorimaea operculella]|nr:CRAL/TRIO domain-containing protein [Phthorimaea operculella]